MFKPRHWLRLSSALFIDFENVQLEPGAMANVLAWIEDGKFEEGGRRRRLLHKAIYWNSTAERNRARYEALGFEVVLCEKYANLKNGADIRMAMDMVEARMRRPNIQEFILISKDSDFVPVLQRLRERKRRTTVLVDESKPAIYTVYTKTADTTFPLRVLMSEGRAYTRPRQTMRERIGLPPRRLVAPTPAAAATFVGTPPLAQPTIPNNAPDFDAAIEKIVAIATRNGGQSTGRQSVTKELQSIPGFTSNGAARYFGFGSYEGLIRAVAERDGRVRVRAEKGGGFSLVCATPPAAKPAKPAKAEPKPRAIA